MRYDKSWSSEIYKGKLRTSMIQPITYDELRQLFIKLQIEHEALKELLKLVIATLPEEQRKDVTKKWIETVLYQ